MEREGKQKEERKKKLGKKKTTTKENGPKTKRIKENCALVTKRKSSWTALLNGIVFDRFLFLIKKNRSTLGAWAVTLPSYSSIFFMVLCLIFELSENDWELPNFTEFYRVLPSFTELYRVFFYGKRLSENDWALPSFTEFFLLEEAL